MSEIGSIQPEPEFAAFIGLDWADQKHIWCLQTAGSAKRETGELEHTPEAVESWVAHLYQRFAQRPIAVAVEQSRGALVFMLSKYERLHLFPVPSQMASSMRQALYPSGAKDDPRDADLLLDLLLQHRNKLRRLSPDSEATRRVQNLVEERRTLVDEKTAQTRQPPRLASFRNRSTSSLLDQDATRSRCNRDGTMQAIRGTPQPRLTHRGWKARKSLLLPVEGEKCP
jgi:hypothetical protein